MGQGWIAGLVTGGATQSIRAGAAGHRPPRRRNQELYFGRFQPCFGRIAVDAYTNFPKFCCHCLEPDPDGTWPISNSQRENLGNGRYQIRSASVRVPMCGQCRGNLRLRDLGAVVGALAAGALFLGWWVWDTQFDLYYLPFGLIFAAIVAAPVLLVLAWLFKVPSLTSIAHLEPDGTNITFANPEYQKMYTGESRRGKKDDVDWRQVHWR